MGFWVKLLFKKINHLKKKQEKTARGGDGAGLGFGDTPRGSV